MQNISFKHYVLELKKKMPYALFISLFFALIAYGISNNIKPSYEVHYSYLTSLSNRDTTSDFRFDGYYALQATDLFTATFAGWVATPEVVVAAYKEGEIELPSQNPYELSKTIHAEKTAPQLVQITVKNESKNTAEKLARGLQAVMQRNVDDYQAKDTTAIHFNVTTTPSWTGLVSVSSLLITVATFVFVLFFAINAVLLYESFKSDI